MLKINIVCVGNLKDKFFVEASEEYVKRLSRFCSVNIIELKEFNNCSSIEQTKKCEGEEIIKNLKGYVILCDVLGEQCSSEKLAEKIERLSLLHDQITFVIGGSNGVSDDVKQHANEKLSVSKMTFPHRLFRIMILEQIYRAETIINGIKYHK